MPPPPPPNESNSVKLNNEIPKESKNVTTDEGISYNVTGKLKTLGDMIINETKPIPESVVEDTNESNSVKLNNEIPKESKNVITDEGIEADNELDDFNEEEDYIKFLQKENMSPMIPKAKSNKLPLPVVTCEWTDKKSANNAPIYRPGLGYSSFIGRSSRITSKNNNKTEEELNLTLKFENAGKKLPPKLQLEVCDPDTGKVVFQKRQNIYYIKLQEKLASLDCDKNYVLKVTSIKDNITADEKVMIHKKDSAAGKPQVSEPVKSIKSNGKEIYLKQGSLAQLAKNESFKEERLVAVKPFNPQSDEIDCIS